MQKKRPSFSISLQLSVLIGFFALSLLGFWFLSTDLTKSFISELTIQSNQDRARKLLDDISRQINISLREMQLLARRPMIISSLERQRDNPPTQSLDPMITGYLIDTYQNRYFIDFGSRLFRDIVLVNTHGDLLAYSEKPTPPFLVQLKRDNQISGDLMLWDVQAYNDDSFPGMGIRVPILNEASEEIGALLALMDLGAILSQMDLSLSLSTRLEILKADGSVVYSNGVFQLLAPSQYTSVLQEKMPLRSYLVDQDTGLLFTLSEIQGHGIFSGFGWKLLLATNLESVFSPVDKLTGLNTSLFLGILLFTLLMAYLIARSFVKPLLDFQSGALELGAGNLNYRFTGSGPSEINDLAQVLNQMSQNLQNSYNQLKTKEAQSKELAANLEESNKDLEEFAYIASHDLQEPLRKVIAYGDLLTEEYKDSLAGEGQHYIGVMQNAAERMSNLISNLLEYSRISSKDLRPNSLQVEEILQEVKSNLSLIMEENTVQLKEPPSYPKVMGQRNQLVHLFQNLIANAIKYKHPDRDPFIQIGFTRQPEEGMIEFSILDNGIGIEEEYFQEIFKPFKRLHGKNAYSGSGIGLSICRKVVQRHGGELKVESQIGKWTKLIFTLPGIPGSLQPIEDSGIRVKRTN